MDAKRLIARLIYLVILFEIVSPYLTTADDGLVLIDEGPVCYSVVFTGRRLSHRYIERSIAVVSLEECKLLCTRETSFDCRSFNYRRRLSSTNCDLSREDSASLDITSSRVFISDPEVDFYQRVGKGQGCFRPYGRPPTSTSGNEYYYTGSNSPVALVTQRPSVNLPAITTSINECYRRLKSGYRIEPRIVRDSINVRSLYECQTECHRSRIFLCRTFSFRQSSGGYNPGGNNCELSDLDPRDLDPVRHLVVDRDADIYERSMVGRNCRDTPVTTWNNYRPNKPNSLCFLRTKSGVRLERRAIRHTVTVHTPMECEQECINAQYFTCRSFSYRFSPSATHADAYHKTHDNCDMSDIDLNSLDPLRDLIDDRLYDSWQRTSYSRDCDLGSYRLPDTSGDGYFYRDDEDFYSLLNPWYHYIQHPLTYTNSATSRCYSSYRRGFRMSQRLVRDSIHVRNLAECEQECSRTRPFTCQTFHFRYTNTDGGYDRNPYNCELSDFSARDFDRFRDMVEDRDYELFTRSQFSSCTYGFTEASSSELSPILASSSSEVTVSGLRCRAGSRCRPHRELGYWYCEINDSHNYNNNWDYCCQPQSRCGYSNGFHYPWCYVGTEASGQWRPCSDRYAERPYAYLHRKLPPNATEPANRPPTKNVEDFIRPILSNSAEISRSNQHIIVKINCTTESPDHQDSVDPELLEEK